MDETTVTPITPKRMTDKKLAAQGGLRKHRAFWKEETTLAVLKRVAEGEITIEQGAENLQTTAAAVTFYLRERGFTQSKRKQDAARAEAPLAHGQEEEPVDVPF